MCESADWGCKIGGGGARRLQTVPTASGAARDRIQEATTFLLLRSSATKHRNCRLRCQLCAATLHDDMLKSNSYTPSDHKDLPCLHNS